MPTRTWTTVVTLAILLAGARASLAQLPPQGRLTRQILVDGAPRGYVVHVPARVDGRRAVPLLVMLHGTGGSGERFYDISGWVEKAEQEGFVAAFPSALAQCLGDDDDRDGVIGPREWVITTKWAAGQLGTPAMPLCSDAELARFPPVRQAAVETRSLPDDVTFIRSMVAALQAELPIDPDRMYVSGFSNGAQMSGRLLIEASDLFAAFGLAAGGPALPGPALRPAPVAFTVGSLDDRFLEVTGLAELPIDGSAAEIPLFQGLALRLCAAVGIDPAVRTDTLRTVNGAAVAQAVFDRSLLGASNLVALAIIDGATHEYPNGTNHPVVMADLLWAFFSRHSL